MDEPVRCHACGSMQGRYAENVELADIKWILANKHGGIEAISSQRAVLERHDILTGDGQWWRVERPVNTTTWSYWLLNGGAG